ncbi:hypothetical protein JHK85_019279 [Glycine max]|nr:hypothetical protein JHK85_019279 [Glycine max]
MVTTSFSLDEVVGILSLPPTETAMAKTVPVSVASMIAESACSRRQRTISPPDLWSSSRVRWKIQAAQVADIQILRPRPSTFVWLFFVKERFAGLTESASRRSKLHDDEPSNFDDAKSPND